MKKQILFIQGGGNGGYEADGQLVSKLKAALGDNYEISYPKMQTDESAPDFGWPEQIRHEIGKLPDGLILAAHSLGASLLLKYLSENNISKKLTGIFLASTPFWNGKEPWEQGLKLRDNFADNLPKNLPIYFYHCYDDDEVPFKNFEAYRQKVPHATFREIESGGHQLGKNLLLLADDISNL